MSLPSASTNPPSSSPVDEGHDTSFDASFTSTSSQGNDHDTSTSSFESTFRLEPPFPTQRSDPEKHPKGKRKRTTAQDKAILEAAYAANDKPDKAARLDIVKRVSLTEKEVQIWFQNRRQNDRRKRRPLSREEFEAIQKNASVRILSSESLSGSMEANSAPIDYANPGDRSHDSRPESRAATGNDGSQHESEPTSPATMEPSTMAGNTSTMSTAEDGRASAPVSLQRARSDTEPRAFSQTSTASIGYVSNRRSFDDTFSTSSTLPRSGDDPFRLDSFSPSISSNTQNSPPILPPLPRPSGVPLSLSVQLNGKAELVSALQSPPRPALPLVPTRSHYPAEHLPPVASARNLQRSLSASITLPPISTLTTHLPRTPLTLTRGRSRDPKAWESLCEADDRDELTKQAENEASGSAVAAISLMRSSSNASLSAIVHGHQPQGKRGASLLREGTNKKPRLERAKSSVAILQSQGAAALNMHPQHSQIKNKEGQEDGEPNENEGTSEPKLQKGGAQSTLLSPSGDSDKENWSPDEDGDGHSYTRHRILPSPPAALPEKLGQAKGLNPRRTGNGRVLGEKTGFNGLGEKNRANTAPIPKRRVGGKGGVAVFEDVEDDGKKGAGKGEVERFMRPGNENEASPSKRGDMDAIASLLSLREGNWRSGDERRVLR
ncbi:hypothetical protein GGR57DRAFT_450734 [Xylariaceae sp. FL1272]|nr:hypothetical protein GGR57DRAFT_450734 [Xylariaceae sp. FL1272]